MDFTTRQGCISANQNEFFPTKGLFYRQKYLRGPPECCCGLRHCIAMLEASLHTRVRSRTVTRSPIEWCSVVRDRRGLYLAGRLQADLVVS
jgi:hypothetical protein